MPRPVRAYTYESCDSFLPRDVLDTLEAPSWVRQGRILIFARTIKQAKDICVNLGLVHEHDSTRPRVASGNDLDLLLAAGYGEESSVLALALDGEIVAMVHFDIHGKRTSTVVGRIDKYNRLFVSES